MTTELYKRFRPTAFGQVVGQDDALSALNVMGKNGTIPHCILFTGPSGVGKTTIGRILRHKLKCGDADYREVNASDERGIDMVRGVRSVMNLAAISGKCRVWMIDEAHKLTDDAQNAFLKILEDTPGHVYFMLSTTDPQKLKKTIITRSHVVKLRELGVEDLRLVVERVCKEEGTELSEDVTDKLVDASEGSARKALVILHAIIGLTDEDEQLNAIAKADFKEQAIQIVRLLMKPGVKWGEVAKVLKDVDEDAESLRYMILGYCKKILLSNGRGKARAAAIMDRMQDNFYDSKQAGLALACYDIVEGGEK